VIVRERERERQAGRAQMMQARERIPSRSKGPREMVGWVLAGSKKPREHG
jgi:hypothetical protein